MTIDPMAEKYYLILPYAYCANNPVKFIDPTGMEPTDLEEDPLKSGRPKKEINTLERLSQYSSDLFSIKIDASSQESLQQSVTKNENKVETIQDATDVINFIGDAISLINPVSSFAEVGAYASSGDYDAVLATVPFALLDIATMGKGGITKTSIKTLTGVEIKGFAKHGLNRIIERGIKPKGILDAIKSPINVKPIKIDELGRESQRFIGSSTKVVINPSTGSIISVNATSRQKLNSLSKIK